MRLYYPAKPFHVNQGWGIKNPIYEQFGFTRHNGIDIALGSDSCLYAPIEGTVVRVGNQPQGGGIFFGIMTDKQDFPDGQFSVLIDFLHCQQILVKEGDKLKIGDKMAIADNTGFSTGPHTHIQPRRVKFWNGQTGDNLVFSLEDSNEANGSFDPIPYFTGYFAQDYNTLLAWTQSLILLLQRIVGSLTPKK